MGTAQKQKGFTAVETLLVILVIAVMGFGGYYVWNTQHNKTINTATKLSTASTSSNSTKTTTDPNAGYFVIKEWNVRAKYNGRLHLEYLVSTEGNNTASSDPSQLNFASTALVAAGQYCNFDDGIDHPGGVVTRATANQIVAGEGPPGISAKDYAETKGIHSAKIGSYYYLFMPEQGPCTDNQIQQQTEDAVANLVSGLQSVPN